MLILSEIGFTEQKKTNIFNENNVIRIKKRQLFRFYLILKKNIKKQDKLIKKLLSHPVKELRFLGKRLEQARDLRVKADYKDQDKFNFNQGESAILTAHSIMKYIKCVYARMNLSP